MEGEAVGEAQGPRPESPKPPFLIPVQENGGSAIAAIAIVTSHEAVPIRPAGRE